jgi:hypothetical protein
MRATLTIPDGLVDEVLRLSGEKTKTKAVVTALEDYVRERRVGALKGLRGQVAIDYDWRAEEAKEMKAAQRRGRYGGR